MKNLRKLLQKTVVEFDLQKAEFQQKEKQIKEVQTINDLERFNGVERMKNRLKQLPYSPSLSKIGIERIFDNNNLMDISFLEKALTVAKTVCRIIRFNGYNKQAFGTGFMVSPELVMTNNHVIDSPHGIKEVIAEFNYQRNSEGFIPETPLFRLEPDRFFLTSEELDYTLIAVAPIALNLSNITLDTFGWNVLSSSKNKILEGERVSIIQHPKGEPKMIAMRENQVITVGPTRIHYKTDTHKGSSGSLVANEQWEIVALHSSGVPVTDEKGGIMLSKGGIYRRPADEPFIIWKANQGILMEHILKDISREKMPPKQDSLKKILLNKFEFADKDRGYRLPQ